MKPRYLLSAAGIVAAGAIAWRIYAVAAPTAPAARGAHHAFEMTVDTIDVGTQAVPLVFQANGRAQTRHSVTVRAQVGGVLKKVLFHEGDRVKAGQLLFVIDPEPYKIKVEQADGKVKQDQAKLAADKANAERMSKLIGNSYVSQQDYENARAQVKQDAATLTTDQAQLDEAKMQLGYTQIRAPINGKTGEITYKAGNLIDANGSTALVTINQIAPISVQFDLPQAQLPTLLHYRKNGDMTVAVADASGKTIATDGKLVFINNVVDQNTGTLSLKALFPNGGRAIWPGELVTVSLTLAVQKNKLVVPMVAVQPGQQGSYVYTVDNGKVAVRNVDVLREYQGLAVIGSGLKPGDLVVVRVPRELHEGLPVKTHTITLAQAVPTLERTDS
ncbi:MAG TPA: efflux RND transporter periplasmic adaptor subunit [Gammaproteobacteria bacterium]|nr:efflux RND transporter periplasmic adaptor subunit [Gammaproteobacteria bacterium]